MRKSESLTEVRTVRSRALSGIERIHNLIDGYGSQTADENSEEMIEDLQKVVAILERWKK